MELHDTIKQRAMVRSFSREPVDAEVVDRIVGAALRSPTAGNTGGTTWVVLEGAEQTAVYWDATTDAAWREANSKRFAGLSRAPVVLLPYTSPETYVTRYCEPDKVGSVLGEEPEAWPVPYWFGDAAFGVMIALLAAVDAGLAACFLGAFRGEEALVEELGVPGGWRLFGAVVLGKPDGEDHPSSSLRRTSSRRPGRLHRGRWDLGERVPPG